MIEMTGFADNIGDKEIDKIIPILSSLDQAYVDNDATQMYNILDQNTKRTANNLFPHITNPKIKQKYSEKMDGLKKLMRLQPFDINETYNYIVNSGMRLFIEITVYCFTHQCQ